MEVRKLQDVEELELCIDIYANQYDNTFIPVCEKRALSQLKAHLGSGAFFRILEDDEGDIRAWILARVVRLDHVDRTVLHQMYYGSDLTGFGAARAIISLHDALVSEAERLHVSRVFSTGSPLDERNVFSRILEKHGWDRRGYAATKSLLRPRS